jgi:ABC-type enterochelin transport system substrate-binding protein
MKSSFELAMERLNKSAPTVKLTADQKSKIAELESKASAKLAERELFLKEEMAKAANAGNFELIEQLEKQLVSERKSIAADLEEKKAKARETAKK